MRMLKSTSKTVRKLLDEHRVPYDDPIILQHDPYGGLSLSEWKREIKQLAEGLDWHEESEEEYIPPDCTVVAAHLFDSTNLPGWSDHGIKRALLVRAGPWDHEREAEINGKIVQKVEFSDGGLADEKQNGLQLALVESFACPNVRAPVKVRFRTINHQDPNGIKGKWSNYIVLDTIYEQGGRESPAVQALMGADDQSGRRPSPPADPKTCKQWIVERLKGKARKVKGDDPPDSLEDAISQLNTNDRSLWTRSGKPRTDVLTRIMRRRVSAAERNKVWKAM